MPQLQSVTRRGGSSISMRTAPQSQDASIMTLSPVRPLNRWHGPSTLQSDPRRHGRARIGRAAARTEEPSRVVARFAIDRHGILREHRGSLKERPMMLATVETVTNANPVWESRRHDPDVAAKAPARESVHAA